MEDKEALEKMITTAYDVGVPQDQLENFLRAGYVPLPWQLEFHSLARQIDKEDCGFVEIGLGGARGPGKSLSILGQITLDDSQRMPGLKSLFLRQTGISAKESFEDLIDKLLLGKISYRYNRSGNVLIFPNKSRIVLGGFENEKDIDKYVGIEYDLIAIEEMTQLSEEKVLKLKGSLRTSKTNWRPRLYASFNPGGLGHFWVKEKFIDSSDNTRFIGSTYKDNPYLNKEYVEYLESLPGDLGRAWREGDWDLFQGQYFQEWRREIHTCKPFTIPDEWKKYVWLDYGYTAPSAVYWVAINCDGIVYLYRELYTIQRTYKELAEDIISLTTDAEKISYWVADPSIWNIKGEDKLSGAELMQAKHRELTSKTLLLKKGNNDRVVGWNVVREYLKPIMVQDKVIAKLQVFTTCPNFITTFPSLIYDKSRVEDLDSDGLDHSADAIRYGLMDRPRQTIDREKFKEKFFYQKMKQERRKKGSGGYSLKMT